MSTADESPFAFEPGWLDVPKRTVMAQAFPRLMQAAPLLMGQASRKDPILLYKAWADTGGFPPYRAQGTGDCVSHAFAHGNDLLQAVETCLGNWKPMHATCTEHLYGASRKVAGLLGGSPGSFGSAAATAMKGGGCLPRYLLDQPYYDAKRAIAWGDKGPPAEVEAQALAFRLGNAAQVQSWDELVEALAHGFPVPECSMFLPSGQRDNEGFCGPEGQGGHAQLICGIRFDREGVCLFNSWPHAFYHGPLVMGQPEGSYWVDRHPHVERMLRQGECWLLSGSPDFAPPAPAGLPQAWQSAA